MRHFFSIHSIADLFPNPVFDNFQTEEWLQNIESRIKYEENCKTISNFSNFTV